MRCPLLAATPLAIQAYGHDSDWTDWGLQAKGQADVKAKPDGYVPRPSEANEPLLENPRYRKIKDLNSGALPPPCPSQQHEQPSGGHGAGSVRNDRCRALRGG